MRHFILSSVVCLVVPCFSTLSRNRCDLREKFNEHKICVLILSTTFACKIVILGRFERDVIINVHTSSCQVPDILVRF